MGVGVRRTESLCLVFALVGAGDLAVAQQPEAEPVPVRFEVQIVRGHESKGVIEPDCESLNRRLPMRFGTLRTIEHRQMNLQLGQRGSLQLPTGRSVQLQPISVMQNRLHMQFQLQGRVNTRLQLSSGKPVIVGGESDGDGAIIIQVTPYFPRGVPVRDDGPRESPDRPGPRLLRVKAFQHAH